MMYVILWVKGITERYNPHYLYFFKNNLRHLPVLQKSHHVDLITSCKSVYWWYLVSIKTCKTVTKSLKIQNTLSTYLSGFFSVQSKKKYLPLT